MCKVIIDRVRGLRSAMDVASLSVEKREKVTTNVVAALIADRIELPSSKLETNPKIHFVSIHQGQVNELIGQVNEAYVINVDAVQAQVYAIWKEKYELVHFPLKGVKQALRNILGEDDGECEFISTIVGAGGTVSTESLSLSGRLGVGQDRTPRRSFTVPREFKPYIGQSGLTEEKLSDYAADKLSISDAHSVGNKLIRLISADHPSWSEDKVEDYIMDAKG